LERLGPSPLPLRPKEKPFQKVENKSSPIHPTQKINLKKKDDKKKSTQPSLLPLPKFTLITLSHPTSPNPTFFYKKTIFILSLLYIKPTFDYPLLIPTQNEFSQCLYRIEPIWPMKDEGSNLNAMIIALKFITSCENTGLDESFQNNFLIRALCKACQYVIIK
jgi:hypothetical protein